MFLSILPAFFRVPLAVFALTSLAVSAASEIHLSPFGADANPGTSAQPVATPQRARELVRGLIAAGLSDAVAVIFAGGTYHLDQPLELRPEDSGTAEFPITWQAAEGATPILSGGKPVIGTWTAAGGGTWYLDLPGIGLGPGQWKFRQLFVNGSRAIRARFPNASAANPFLYATGGGFDHALINPALVKPAWGTAADAQINIVPQSRFFNQWNTVTAVNPGSGRIDIADSERHRRIDSGSWFWIEGAREELDEPGEWFLDTATGRLHYMPEPGIDPNTLEFVAPFLNRIINVKGDANAGIHVAHVHFEGFHFRHTTFSLGHNHFNDLSRNGVFAFRNQGGNVVEYNHIHNALQTTIDGGCIHFATMNHLNAPNFILNNWLYDIWGNERLPDGTVNRRLANGVFLDWDTSNTTVKDNWIYNSVGGAVKVIWNNWNVVNTGNPSSSTPITPPFLADVGPEGTATNGIDLASNQLTGSVIHYTQSGNFATTGTWTQESATGIAGLFVFNYLVGTAGTPSEATYTLPIPEPGFYQISLLYKPGNDRASNAPIAIAHADGTANMTWNMRQGSTHGFAVDAIFNRGSSNPWQEIISNRPLDRAPNTDQHTGDRIALPGQSARFVALRVDSHYGGSGVGLGKVRFDVGESTLTYELTPADAGKYIIVEIIPVAASGTPTGHPETFTFGPVVGGSNAPPGASNVTIQGSAMVGATLSGAYLFSDPEGDAESGSTLEWFRSADTVLDGADVLVATGTTYTVESADAGKFLFFRVTPRAASGASPGTAVHSSPVLATSSSSLVAESFGGSAIALNGKSAEMFSPLVTAAGGSPAWTSAAGFLQNGAASGGHSAAGLNLGNFINHAKGTPEGKFVLTATLAETTGNWVSLGFAAENTPNTAKNFTNTGSGTAPTTGLGTILYRAQSGVVAPNANGDLDPDGDGIPNGIEAWFGTHPGEHSSGIMIVTSDGLTTIFTHPHNPAPPVDLTGTYEWSPDLSAWHPDGGGPAGGPTVRFLVESADATTVTATSNAAMPRFFLRASVSGN